MSLTISETELCQIYVIQLSDCSNHSELNATQSWYQLVAAVLGLLNVFSKHDL